MKIYRRGVKLDLSIAVVVMFLLLLHMTGMMYKRELHQMFNEEVNISKRGFRRFRSSEIVDKEDGTSKVPSEVAEGPAGTKTDHIPAYNMFHQRITKDAMYEPSAFYIFNLLDELATGEISNVSLFPGGSQIKFKIHFKNGNVAIAKPKRHDRGRYWAYDQSEPFWLDNERHNAEIASFHLDRILNFRRVPPCVGRIVNFRKEILPNTKDEEILSTLYINNGNFCFIGNCVPWFCNDNNPICSEGDFMEMSLCVLVYPSVEHPFQDRPFPWSQGIVESEIWKERNICTEMLVDPEITMGRFFLDLMDLAVFDHLIQNYDRHHFTIVVRFNVESFVVIVDNGKGFGNPWKDDTSFLAPIYQCCRIRNSTYQTLLDLSTDGSKLGNLLRLSLSQDPLAPVITEIFFETLERRLGQVLREIDKCIENYGDGEVLVDKVVVT